MGERKVRGRKLEFDEVRERSFREHVKEDTEGHDQLRAEERSRNRTCGGPRGGTRAGSANDSFFGNIQAEQMRTARNERPPSGADMMRRRKAGRTKANLTYRESSFDATREEVEEE